MKLHPLQEPIDLNRAFEKVISGLGRMGNAWFQR